MLNKIKINSKIFVAGGAGMVGSSIVRSLHNHGFENMESLGAIYSRISSHILGDWNACGKVMGLAPWAGKQKSDTDILRNHATFLV